MTITSINPATGEKLKSYNVMEKEQVLVAIDQAQKAFTDWRQTDFAERKARLSEFSRLLREQSEECAALITLEMGKRIAESRKEIAFCADITDFYAQGAEKFLADKPMDLEGVDAYIQYAPIGVLMGFMPWNFPFYQVVRFAVPNIMAGNTVLLRHASNVPQCAEKIQQLFDACGLPAGVYTNLLIDKDLVAPIVADKRLRGVSLTGSERAGASVAELAGKNLKRTVLELGGNDAFIVLEDADLEEVIPLAVKGRMVNTGQSCVAAKRFIVVEPLIKDFTAAMQKAMEGLTMGDPMDENTEVGPLSTEDAAVRLNKQVQSAIKAGATVVLGGDRPERTGAFFNPTILTGIKPDEPTFDQELFGPVATIYAVKDEAAAIALANDSSYGLGGSVYTRDIARGRRVAEQIDTGMVFINQPTNSSEELPFGGTKNSGWGRELSHLGILEFINKKLIHCGPVK